MTFLRKVCTCSTNSGLNCSRSISARFWSWSSLVKGLIMVQQSRSLKKLLSKRLMRFLLSTISEKPFWGESAFSRYSLLVMGSWSASINYNVKSRTTHINDGKYWAYSSGSWSSLTPPALIWICLVKLITSESWLSAFSSMLPTELYMKKLASKMARENILTSWLLSSSRAPKPSVSSTSTLIGSPSGVMPSIGFPQIQTPYTSKQID